MATAAIYTLLPMFERSGTHEGRAFQTGRRTRWDATLRVGQLESGGSVTVELQASSTGEEDDWRTLDDFGGAKSATGETAITGVGSGSDFTVTDRDVYIRAEITAATGEYAVEVTASAPFLDPTVTADKNLLSKELREWGSNNGGDLARVVEQAERDVLAMLRERGAIAHRGIVAIDLRSATTYDEMRAMIAEQADWQAGTEDLKRRAVNDSEASGLLAERPLEVPGLTDRVQRLLAAGDAFWMGR